MIKINGKEVHYGTIMVDGVDHNDYPDYCDAYIYEASFVDGGELNDFEIDELNDRYPEIISEIITSR